MSEQDNKRENKMGEIDLSELSNLQFATAWTPSSNISPKTFSPRKGGDFKGARRDRDGDSPSKFRERGDFRKRSAKFPPRQNKSPEGSSQEGNKSFKRHTKPFDRRAKKEPFVFSMEVLFYPEDAPFNKLSDIIKASKRTYQLFDIAEIILEKPERFVVLAKNLPDAEGSIKPLYCAQPLNIPFEDEASAKASAIEFKLDELFATEEIDAEPPKGEFQVVNKCSITGDLLGAPNWHKYGENLREYHNRKFPRMPFEKFTASIETVRDAEQIAAWLEQMKKKTVFKLKTPVEGAPDSFESREAACAYIAQKFGDQLVKTYEQVRLRGENIAKMPFGKIRRNIEEACRKQKKFPIVTANNLRGRLRRSGFAVYKRGSKSFAFVSVIKRKFIFEGETLSEVPQKIFDFIVANPAIKAVELPYKYLGLETPKSEPKVKTLAQEHSEGAETLDSQKPSETAELSDETKAKLSSVWSELAWLVSEGYVVEYANGTLQANPYLPKPKDKSQIVDTEAEAAKTGDEPLIAEKAKPASEAPEEVADLTVSAEISSEAPEAVANETISAETSSKTTSAKPEAQPTAEAPEIATEAKSTEDAQNKDSAKSE